MMSLWDALRMNKMISYQELVRTFPNNSVERDRPQAALVGSLRGFAATAAPHVKRYIYKEVRCVELGRCF